MKIEIDLSDLGVVRYDDDGDPVPGPSMTDRIVDEAARMIVGDERELRQQVMEKVSALVAEEVEARVKVLIEEIIAEPIQRTSAWGEKQGEPTTVKEIIRLTAEKWLTGTARRGHYDSRDTPARSLQEVVEQTTDAVLTREMKDAIDKAKIAVTGTVVDKALEAVKDQLAKV